MSAATSPSLDDDADESSRGDWLFKRGDTVLGPVPASVIVQQIKDGQLPAETPVARDGQPFQPMKLVPSFREAYDAMVLQKRRVAEERAYQAAVARSRLLRALILGFAVLLPAAAGAFVGRTLQIQKPWDDTPEWMAKVPPVVDLPPRPVEVKITPLPPPAPVMSDEPPAPAPVEDAPDKPRRVAARARASKDEKAGQSGDKASQPEESAEDQSFVKELTNEQAVAPLKNPRVRSALGVCFRAELESNPSMPSPISLAYTITESGRSTNVEITNRELRDRPLQECVRTALSLARWPRFEGERKNVTVPFNIKKPQKAP